MGPSTSAVGSWSFATVVMLAEKGLTSGEHEQQRIPSPSTNEKSVWVLIPRYEVKAHITSPCGPSRTSTKSLLS
ncbi:hypothetical protein BKA82DRAFT_991240 [Pisolithus tinctorius]|uniref:Uncharacterized protein n=1 Tax=Pisolithus tinctorius Marx 270 TaxID=870435 RepID=A0A0C3PY53_PISTI|nr:hypothetical protein BKA82DRAFT_991240 [Pisolithus tinctorius]KIO14486.1 hypothetical protein M404DRAFT_991240 [Pisolithus tinctorius Marx 270]